MKIAIYLFFVTLMMILIALLLLCNVGRSMAALGEEEEEA